MTLQFKREVKTPLPRVGPISTEALYTQLRRRLAERLTQERLLHVCGVEGMSVLLARRWGIPEEKAILAALLHDIAKGFPRQEQARRLDQLQHFPPNDEDRLHPSIWHGLIAAEEALVEWRIEDAEVLEAVAWHPTGCRNMGPVGLNLFVADHIEPARHFPGVEKLRRELQALPLQEAALGVASRKWERLKSHGGHPHSRTRDMVEWLQESVQKEQLTPTS